MEIALCLVVLVAVCALAAVGSFFRLGKFSGILTSLRIDVNRGAEDHRKNTEYLSNHIQTLGEKVEKTTTATNEMNRLLRGARDDRDSQNGKRRSTLPSGSGL